MSIAVTKGLWSVNTLKTGPSKAHRKLLMVSLTLNNSLSNVECFCSVVESARGAKANGCQCLFTFCSREALIFVSDN
uniref:Uncharacterized protein n=1 Tax=Lepeophtheirus salmonis TaxID=72036 RepID=A0A0K2UCX8_LEPSM